MPAIDLLMSGPSDEGLLPPPISKIPAVELTAIIIGLDGPEPPGVLKAKHFRSQSTRICILQPTYIAGPFEMMSQNAYVPVNTLMFGLQVLDG